MLVIGWLVGLARRRKARIIGLTLGIAIAVSLIATLGAFFASSESKMTSRAVAGVPVDWQVQLRAGANPAQVRDAIVNATSARSAAVVGYGHVSRFRSRIGGSVQTTGSGMALGLPADYAASFPGEIRYLVGSHSGVLLAQQGAANLHASVGSTVSVVTAPGHSVDMKVQGIIDLPHADSLFQTIGLPASAAPSAPPDNVVIMPLAKWHSIFDAVSKQDPTSASLQVHVKLPPGLPADPGAAFASVQQRANNLEVTLAGKGLVGDNLAAQLDATRGDAIYAELLFLFLGLPGVAVTAAVVGAFGAVDADRRRSEQALLRLRGATRSRVIGLAAMEAISVAIAGSILGLLGAQAIARGVFSSGALGATTRQSTIWGAAATLTGLLLALVTIALPAARAASGISIGRARRLFAERSRPIWMILYLDVVLLAIGGLIYWKAVRSGFQVVLAPEGVPTISVDYFTLLAPLFLWVGAALLVWRCARSLLTRGRRMIAAATKPLSGPLASTVASSMSRQHRLLARGVVVLALTVTFAISTAVFNATFQEQSKVDAQLTNGSDVTVTSTAQIGLPRDLPARIQQLPGVIASEPMQHRYAYVGNDLQDLYGINPKTVGRAAPISNAFFSGGSASQIMSRLAAQPDAALVSDETVHDFQLHLGDLVRLRLQFAGSQQYRVVPFHYVGIVREFPTAPRDSFIVANSAYVAARTGRNQFETVLTRTNSPIQVAGEVTKLIGPGSGATVQDVQHQLQTTLSGLPAIDLAGLTRVELSLALLLAICASGATLILGLAERKRTFAILTALGAKPRQLGSFVWSETAFLATGGLTFGIAVGWGIAYMLVKILTGVFDPPPEHLFVPWAYLSLIAASGVVAFALGGRSMIWTTRRPSGRILRDL